ncbi:MAG: hypothetical protein EHM61_01265 [Acidobacteria bacterium]|nr:MAG: hypothetical protein EHM61_01265 [Acidobacteriota bacterium]
MIYIKRVLALVLVIVGTPVSSSPVFAQSKELSVIVRFRTALDPAKVVVPGLPQALARARLKLALQTDSQTVQASARSLLRSRSVNDVAELWLINGLCVTAPIDVISDLLQLPEVQSVTLDEVVNAPVSSVAAGAAAAWNVEMIGAAKLWSAGINGQGTVVAVLDTGVDAYHPDLKARWRGGANSWFDPHGQHSLPFDANGHGTQVAGLIVGGSSSGTAVGVAPGAQWIAAKIFNDSGYSTYAAIHQAFQWLLDPDGQPSTDDAPDVVNNSWQAGSSSGCIFEFQPDIQALKAAGIAVVFGAGNQGPRRYTSTSPANNVGAFAVGAVDSTQTIALFSSRGPGACDPTGAVFPAVVAPGVAVRTTDRTFEGVFPNSYVTVNGTSFASPQIAGAMALLKADTPTATVDQLERVLRESAADLGTAGPDDSYGYGLVNLDSARLLLRTLPPEGPSDPPPTPEPPPPPPPNAPPVANHDSAATQANTAVRINVLANDTDPEGTALTAELAALPSYGRVVKNVDQTFTYAPAAGITTDQFTYRAKDAAGAVSNIATVTVTVQLPVVAPPIAVDDSAVVRRNSEVVINVLGNDIAGTGTIEPATVTIVSASAQSATVYSVGDGTIFYAAPKNFRGIDTFSYTVKNIGSAASNAATVRITIVR